MIPLGTGQLYLGWPGKKLGNPPKNAESISMLLPVKWPDSLHTFFTGTISGGHGRTDKAKGYFSEPHPEGKEP